MFFVIDRPQFRRMIALVRDDRTAATQGPRGPYLRLEANNDSLTLTGQQIEAAFPATVYEPGVLFLQVTVFRRLLATFKGEKMFTIQVTGDKLLMGPVEVGLAAYGMLLYPVPAKAPKHCPLESPAEEPPRRDERLLWSDLEPPAT